MLHHSVRVIGERMTGNSLHRLPCRLENDDVANAGSYSMLGFQACPARPQARYAGGLASLYCRAVTEPHLAACDKKYCSLSSSFESWRDRAGGSISPFVIKTNVPMSD